MVKEIMNNNTLIIAEAGVNHNGDVGLALQLVDAAANAGADVVKFQTFCADRMVTATAQKAEYQRNSESSNESQYQMLKRLELTRLMHLKLIEHCDSLNIKFFSTGFDLESIEMLIELGLDYFKIPSGEINNLPYLRYVGKQGKPIFLSTGMATIGEIELAIDALESAGTNREKITVMHCTSEYPTPMEDVNLKAMCSIGSAFGVNIGYSDHTEGTEVAIAAVALGAKVIEKHFTLDRSLPGPDHKASLEPDELKSMVSAIRNIERAMGDGVKKPCKNEIKNRSVARKSLVASKKIAAGELFSSENVAVKRPGFGMSPMMWDKVIGSVAPRSFCPDEYIEM